MRWIQNADYILFESSTDVAYLERRLPHYPSGSTITAVRAKRLDVAIAIRKAA